MASDRPALRPQRLALFLLLALLLGLLLEMNRWLPGGWPGGGGTSGFRSLEVAQGGDPSRLAAAALPSPDWTPEQGVRLEVRAPDGSAAAGWRAGVGGRTSLDRPEGGAAWLLVRDRDLAAEGIRVLWAGGQARHVPPLSVPPSPVWRVGLPATALPALVAPQDLVVEVVDALTGRPVAGAQVFGPGAVKPAGTDAAGHAALKGLGDRAQVRVSAPGYLETMVYGHPGVPAPLRVPLSPRTHLNLRLIDPASGREAEVTSARVLDGEGALLWESAPGAPRTLRVEADLAADRLDGARLVVEAPGRPRTDAPLPAAGNEVPLVPAGRALDLVVRDASGRPVKALAATVRYGASGRPAPEHESAGVEARVTADPAGRLRVQVPESTEAVVVVESAGHGPASLRVDPGDGPGERDVIVSEGLGVPVRVLDARGRPVREAQVVARSVVDGVRVVVSAVTDAEGLARVGPVARGSVELFAHAPGRAWNGATVEAQPAMGRVELRLLPGGPLRLVVETPVGAPLAGVHVTATPEDQGLPDVQPPEPAVWRTAPDGALVLDDLPQRSYRLRLSLPGYAEETLHDVRPGAVTYFATLIALEASAPRR